MGLFNDIVKQILIENILLTEADGRLKRLRRKIAAEFSGILDVNRHVPGPEYYVNDREGPNPNTTWLDYLEFHFRHEFGLMGDSDMKYFDVVANLAYSDEVGFDKRNDNGTEIATLQNIVMLLKKDDELFQQVKANPNITFIELYNQLKPQLQAIDDADSEAANNVEVRNDYDIIEVPDFDTANYYGNYSCSSSKLCYTQGETTWYNYTQEGANRVYVCLKHGWEDIPEEPGEGNPYDEYGTSMIFVFINPEGDIAYSNCRWNHKNIGQYNGSVDHAFTKATLSETVGVRFDDVFKPYSDEELMEKKGIIPFDKVQELLDRGASPVDVFEEIYDENEGFYDVYLNDKYNFIDKNNKLLSPNLWFDDVRYFCNGFAVVYLRDTGFNFINTNGDILSPNQWFNDVRYFRNGVAWVYIRNKGYNFINTNGDILSPNLWFDESSAFDKYGIARVRLIGKGYNFIKTNGELLSPNQWFDMVDDFNDGSALVFIKNKGWNFINTNGEFTSPNQWFDKIGDSYEGSTEVYFNDEWHKIDRNGNIVEGKSSKKSMIMNNFKDMLNRMDEVRKNGSIIL